MMHVLSAQLSTLFSKAFNICRTSNWSGPVHSMKHFAELGSNAWSRAGWVSEHTWRSLAPAWLGYALSKWCLKKSEAVKQGKSAYRATSITYLNFWKLLVVSAFVFLFIWFFGHWAVPLRCYAKYPHKWPHQCVKYYSKVETVCLLLVTFFCFHGNLLQAQNILCLTFQLVEVCS